MSAKQEWQRQSKGMIWMGAACMLVAPFTVGMSLIGTAICWSLAAKYSQKADSIPDDYVEPSISETGKPAADCSKAHGHIPDVEVPTFPAKRVLEGPVIIKGDRPRTGRRRSKPKQLPAPPETIDVGVKKPTVVRSKWNG